MVYYLSPYTGTGDPLGGPLDGEGFPSGDPYRPLIADGQPVWGSINLRPDSKVIDGLALVWLPAPPSSIPGSRSIITLGDSLDESIPASVARSLERALSLTLDQTDRLRSIIAELLIFHGRVDGTRWRNVKVDQRGRHRIVLGPDVIFDAPVISATTLTETWTAADTTDKNIDADLDWDQVTGDANSGFDIVSNGIENVQSTGGVYTYRTVSQLASDDHYAEGDPTTGTATSTNRWRLYTRFEAAADTHYAVEVLNSGSHALELVEAGSVTQLASGTGADAPASGAKIRLEVDGSSLEWFQGGTSRLTATDTTLTGQTRAGVGGRANGSNRVRWLGWEAGDLAAGGVVIGQVIDTSTAQPLTPRKTVQISQASGASLAHAMIPAKSRTLGQAVGTNVAESLGVLKEVLFGQALEADVALAIVHIKTVAIGQSLETDTAFGVRAPQAVLIGQVSETSTAQALTSSLFTLLRETTGRSTGTFDSGKSEGSHGSGASGGSPVGSRSLGSLSDSGKS